jgi:hypothetical protein
MTVLLGPVPCATCKAPVTVVRRPVMIHGHVPGCGRHGEPCASVESTEMREVVVLSRESIEHACYTVGAEYSGASDIMHTATRPALRLYSEVAGRVRSGVQTE